MASRGSIHIRALVSFLIAGFVMVTGFSLPIYRLAAQDDAPIVCDSSLVTQVLVAELDLGYIPPDGIAQLDFGQFTPIQEAIEARMQEQSAEEMAQAEAAMAEMLAMMEAMESMEMPPDVTLLQPVAIQDEDEFCNILRTNLDAFLYLHLALELNMIAQENR
jgi:hypothetical protein